MNTEVERREHKRTTSGAIAFMMRAFYAHIQCRVANISEGEAVIELREDVLLPYAFALTIDGTDFTAIRETRHHEGNRIGVAFTSLSTFAAY